MNDMVITLTNNKRYIKVNKYEALFAEKDSNKSTESIEYEERLIEYEKDYETYDLYQNWDRLEISY